MKLNQKILLGYVLLLLIIGSMVGVIVYERKRMRNIEMEVSEIQQVRRDINTAHRHITQLPCWARVSLGGMIRIIVIIITNDCIQTVCCEL